MQSCISHTPSHGFFSDGVLTMSTCRPLSPVSPKLQIFMTRASRWRQPLTPPVAVWLLFLLTMDVWRGEVFHCLLLQGILKGNECTNITGKKRALCKVVQSRTENSNNISLKKSTSDTLLLRTYKQTELLCAHINNRNARLLGCRPLRATGS